jgi:hypothetical protein
MAAAADPLLCGGEAAESDHLDEYIGITHQREGRQSRFWPRCDTADGRNAGAEVAPVGRPSPALDVTVQPREQLATLSISVVHDLPGVGENLLNHPEITIIWELKQPVPTSRPPWIPTRASSCVANRPTPGFRRLGGRYHDALL